MKSCLNVNLAKQYVDSPHRRRCVYCGIHLYLLVVGVILVATVYISVRKLTAIQDERRQIAAVERIFRRGHPEQGDMTAYIDELQSRLQSATQVLEDISLILAERTDLAQLLLGIAQPLTDIGELTRFSWNHEEQSAAFEIAVDMVGAENGVSGRQLVERWESDPALASLGAEFNAVSTERQMIGERVSMVFSFTCDLE